MMKRRMRLIPGIILLMLGLGMTACGKGAKDSVPDEAKITEAAEGGETVESAKTAESTGDFDMERARKSVMIKGVSFEIPKALSDLEEGWTWKEHENSETAFEGRGLVWICHNHEEWFPMTVENYYEDAEDEAVIYNLTIRTEDCSIDGLIPLKSTKRDVVEKYGEPMEISKGAYLYGIAAEQDDTLNADSWKGQRISISFDEEDMIETISITYYIEVERENVNSYDVSEMLSDLTIEGVPIGWAYDLEDVKKIFEIEEAQSTESYQYFSLYEDDSHIGSVGEVWADKDNSGRISLELSYPWNDGSTFEFKGVTEKSSYEDVIRLLGEPTERLKAENHYITYYNYDAKGDKDTYDEISIGFHEDDSISSITFYYAGDNQGRDEGDSDEAKTARSDGEIAARMENFSVGGCNVSLPCTVGEFVEKFELEYSYPVPEVPDTMCCSYLIDGEPAGVIFVYCKEGKVHDTDYVYTMSIDEFSIVKEQPFAFEVSGIREDMTREQIKELWGEPDSSGTRSIIYCDGEYEDTWDVDKITIGFDDDSGKIDDIAFFVSLDRIEGLEGK